MKSPYYVRNLLRLSDHFVLDMLRAALTVFQSLEIILGSRIPPTIIWNWLVELAWLTHLPMRTVAAGG